MVDIAVIDYGMGNLRSVSKALEHVAPEKTVAVTSDPQVIANASRVVFPGVGAMPDCVRELESRQLRQHVLDAARNKPFLGICLGMQALFEFSEEGHVSGLGVLPGRVERFSPDAVDAQGDALKVPQIGWNRVTHARAHSLWEGIPEGERFYFVHSYYCRPARGEDVVGETCYPHPYASAVARDNLFAVQFHPEKSQAAGLRLLANFVGWNGQS